MCEVVICVRDMTSADFYINSGQPKRGDIIAVAADGTAWSNAELSNPDWRIVRLVGVSVAVASAFLAREISTVPPEQPQPRTLQYRGFKLDVDDVAIPAGIRAVIADDTRASPVLVFAGAAALVAALKKARAAIPDPAIIGGSPAVL